MSPRSEELLSEARARLAAARENLEIGHPEIAIGVAYYAMLYAARAALSERDLHAKTHGGAWSLFARTFVEPGVFDRDLARKAGAAKDLREDADYEAARPTEEEAASAVEDADRFIEAISALID